jgi:hypothetical protein
LPAQWGYSAKLALRGDWGALTKRCDAINAQSAASYENQDQLLFLADNRFYAALARGDILAMEGALAEMTDPALVRKREGGVSPIYDWVTCAAAVVGAKIAWRHGYKVNPTTPYIPLEWLPPTPLKEYRSQYSFLDGLDIEAPLPVV